MEYENDSSWVRGMLQPGETLLWSGRPGKVRVFGKEDVILIPFSLVWCGFLAFSVWSTWSESGGNLIAGIFPKLFLIPFVVAGLWLLVGRFVVKVVSAKKECYALTSQRIIIQKGKTTRSLELTDLPPMSVTQRSDGSGDILFGDAFRRYNYTNGSRIGFSWNTGGSYQTTLTEFRAISDVSRVEYRIRQAADRARAAADGQ